MRLQVTTSPAPVSTSISSTDSCGVPLRKLELSIPRPVTAPPKVIVLSCGTTSGINPCGRVASTKSSYVVMPSTSAVRASASTRSTPENALTSSRGASLAALLRNRLDVRLPSRTGAPAGSAAYCSRSRETAPA